MLIERHETLAPEGAKPIIGGAVAVAAKRERAARCNQRRRII
jgi:hypothetical protein